MNRAIFLDRDGVINRTIWNATEQLYDSPYRLAEFELLPGAAQAISQINRSGFLAVVISNQPGIAKGKCSPDLVQQMTAKMHAELAAGSARLDAVYYCLHHPEAVVARYRIICDCRKPNPGLLLRAARDLAIDTVSSFMIGDQERDIEAGRRAGCRTILVSPAAGAVSPGESTARNLGEAVQRACAA